MKRSTISLIIAIIGAITSLFSFYVLFITQNMDEMIMVVFTFSMSCIISMLAFADYQYAKTFNR